MLLKKIKKLLQILLITLISSLIMVSLSAKFPVITTIDKFVQGFEQVTYDLNWDLKFKVEQLKLWQGDGATQINTRDNRIVIVDIDIRALEKMGAYWQWPRTYHAQVVDELTQGGAAAIPFDILFKTADFGLQKSTQVIKTLSEISPNTNWATIESKIRAKMNDDSIFVESIKNSPQSILSGVFHPVSAYNIDSNNAINKLGSEKRRLEISPESALLSDWEPTNPQSDLLDGIFKELASANNKMGVVNVVPDPDGIHRSEPLFYQFPSKKLSPKSEPRLYPILSLQTLLYVTGIQPQELKIFPGKSIITPPLFGVFKDSSNQLQVLNPGISFHQVEDILSQKKSILDLVQNKNAMDLSRKSLEISQPIKIAHTEDGIQAFIMDAQEIPTSLLKLICDTSNVGLILGTKKTSQNFSLNENYSASWDKTEGMYRIDDIEEDEEYYFYKRTFEIIIKNRLKIQNLTLNESISLIEKHEIRWNSYLKKYISNLAGFANNSVQEIAKHKLNDFTSLPIGDTLRIGSPLEIPIDEHGRLVVSYLGKFNTQEAYKPFKTISYYDVWAKRIDPSFYAGKIFILGSTAPALFDYISAPAESVYPGVMLHANLISSMLNNNFLSQSSTNDKTILIILAALIGALIGVSFNPFIGTIITFILAIIWFLFQFFVFQDQNFNLGYVQPQIANFLSFALGVLLLYFLETKQRKKTEGYFKNYISPELIDMMLESDEPLQLGGEEGILSAYFTDIASFSTFSEKIGSPTKLVELLNEYLTAMTDILIEEKGTLDKYEGDAIIAFFGAPVNLKNHAEASISSAIAMQNKLNELRALWKSQGDKWPVIVHDMRMRIGINSGPIVTGNMGSNVRMNYTMMGDTVNLAARLESGAKQYGVFTMTSSETIKLGGSKFLYRKVDLIRVVGKNEPVEVYEIFDFKDKATESLKELVSKFEKAWELYKACNWHLAEDLFMECTELEPHNPKWAPGCKTTPSHVFLERIEAFKKNPPTQNNEEWDGIYTATEK